MMALEPTVKPPLLLTADTKTAVEWFSFCQTKHKEKEEEGQTTDDKGS